MKLVAVVLAGFVLAACAADGEMKVNASTNDDTKTSASASASVEGTGGSGGAVDPPEKSEAKPMQIDNAGAGTGEPAAAACPLVCYVANKGRAAPADEQRLTSELANELTLLRGCGSSNVRPSLTLRFESSGQLSGFGVDAERGNEGACVNSIREHKPTVSYPGPATLRCSEKCGGEPTRATRRRRAG